VSRLRRAAGFAWRHPHWTMAVLLDMPYIVSGIVLYFAWPAAYQVWVNATVLLSSLAMFVLLPVMIACRVNRPGSPQ
jgi:hypothetical protein